MSRQKVFNDFKEAMMQEQSWKKYRRTPQEALEYVKQYAPKYCPEVQEYPNSLPDEFKQMEVPNKPSDLKDKIIGLIFGQATGDAIGLATEFMSKQEVDEIYSDKVIKYDHYYIDQHRGRWMNEQGKCADWTDDTDQFLLILDDIVRNNGNVDVNDFAKRCYYWVHFGFTEIGDIGPLGVGMNFRTVLTSKGFIDNPIECSKAVWEKGGCKSAANGCVMRTSILGVPYFWDEEKMIENTTTICKATHYDPRCQACSVVVTLMVSSIIKGEKDVEKIIEYALNKTRPMLTRENDIKDFDKFLVNMRTLNELNLEDNMGYVFKTTGSAIYGLRQVAECLKNGEKADEIFKKIITEITLEGGDADTNCAVVGSVIGCYLGESGIPEEWIKLDNINWLIERINRVLRLVGCEEKTERITLHNTDTK